MFRKIFQYVEPKSKAEHKVLWISLAIMVGLLGLDQWSKYFIDCKFAKFESLNLIPNFFSLTYVTNKGAAWSILEGQIWFFLSVAAVMLAGMIIFLRKLTAGWSERYFALAMLISGIIGNAIDRVLYGEVIDFLDVFVIWNGVEKHWPIFNIADCAICVGISIFILSSLIRPDDKTQNNPPQP